MSACVRRWPALITKQNSMEHISYNGDLFINGDLLVARAGSMIVHGSLTYNISESSYADEWLTACLESPNIVDDDMVVDFGSVDVFGDLYVWGKAVKDTTGTVALDAFKAGFALDIAGIRKSSSILPYVAQKGRGG